MKKLHQLAATLTSVCALWAAGPALAQNADTYPNKPIRIVVPFAAGGPTDVIARVVANNLKNVLERSRTGGVLLLFHNLFSARSILSAVENWLNKQREHPL